jgi:hypothetical protein
MTELPQIEIRSPPTALYRLLAADGALLYVGITENPRARMKQHAAGQAWWPEVERNAVTFYPDYPAARAAEIAAIRDEAPRYNRAGAWPRIPVERVADRSPQQDDPPGTYWIVMCPHCRSEHIHPAVPGPQLCDRIMNRGYVVLADEGVVYTVQGRGTFVSKGEER